MVLVALEQTLIVEGLKDLANAINITEHSDERTHRDPPYQVGRVLPDTVNIRGPVPGCEVGF